MVIPVKYFIKSLVLLGWLCSNVYSYLLNVNSQTTFIFRDYGEQFLINDIPYREASTFDKQSSLFAITLSHGNYNVTNEPYYSTTMTCMSSRGSNNNRIVIARRPTLIDQVNVSIGRHSRLWISGRVSSLPVSNNMNSSSPPYYKLLVNNIVILENVTSIFSVFMTLPVEEGLYNVKIVAIATNQPWCSCPSRGNGFILSHGLWAWSIPNTPLLTPEISTKIVQSIPNRRLFSLFSILSFMYTIPKVV